MKRMTRVFWDYAIMGCGTWILAFAVKNLFDPMGLVTGGISGLAIILKELWHVPLWITNVVINVPLFLLAIPMQGWKFVQRTLYATAMLTIGLAILPKIDIVGDDMMLSSLFGGVLSGIGVGLILLQRATSGGTDLLSALIHKKLPRFSLVEILQAVDAIIVVLGIAVFGIRQSLYALLAVYISMQVSDGLLEGMKFSKQAMIISEYAQDIAKEILTKMDRGVTGFYARGMYSKEEKLVLICVVAKKEIVELKTIVHSIDENAFVTVSDVREVLGEGFLEKQKN